MSGVSIIVPVYSGEDHLHELVERIAQTREQWARDHPEVYVAELILVNDAAKDNSPIVIKELTHRYYWAHSITLSKNFGQHPATAAGILHSSGDWVVTMDEDLQHRPADIEALLQTAVTEYADVVYANPQSAVHASWYRDLSSKVSKLILSYLTGNQSIRHFSSFRLCRGSVARAGASVAGHETYLDVSLTWFTDRFSVRPLPMTDRRFQASATSGYNLRRLLEHARRLIISSHNRVINAAAYIGLLAIVLAAFFGLRAVLNRLLEATEPAVPGWASVFVSILFFGGLIVFLLVVILEYLINVALHTQGKPTFFVVDRSVDDEVAANLGVYRAPSPSE